MPHYRINAPGQHGQNVNRLHEDARDYIKKVRRSVRFPLTPGDYEPETYRGARHYAIRVRTWANVPVEERGGPAGVDRYAPLPTDIAIHCVLANHGPVANIYSVVLDPDDIVKWSSPRDGARFRKDVLKGMINP